MNERVSSTVWKVASDCLDYNVKALEMSATSSLQILDWIRDAAKVKSPADVAGMWIRHGRRQLEASIAQGHAFAELARRMTADLKPPSEARGGTPTSTLASDDSVRQITCPTRPGAAANSDLTAEEEVLLLHVME